jgi:glycosyltransferase involved in cell wall biosynthesis
MCGAPLISIVHHLRAAEDHPALLLPLYRFVETRYLQSVQGFIYNSHTTRRIVEKQIERVTPNVVAYPAGNHRPMPDRADVLHKIATRINDGSTLQLLFVGNLMARKGLHTVLNALARQVETRWHLHVVGSHDVDPDYSKTIRHQANVLNLGQRITWHGRLSDETLAQLFARCDLLVMPSYEGFGIVYLEAMGFGLPVLAANTGAAPELITPGENGYLISPTDDVSLARQIALLQRNRVVLGALSFHARQRYETHPTWAESMYTVSNWLHEVIS